jgi:hypothetical protein
MAVIGNLIIGIEATTKGLRSGIEEAEGMIGRAGKTLGTLGSIAGKVAVAGLAAAAVGTMAVAATLPKLISMGSDAEEMMGKYNVVFGEFAAETTKVLDTMAGDMGRSKFEMREFASSFQDTFVPMGFARDEAAKLSTQLTELTYDVASFNNAQESDVARDFQSAIVGNTETVRKYGIVINQSILDQELLSMGVKDGIKNATEAQKVQARLNLIMKGTTDAQGDAVRTGGSWANQMRALKSTISDVGTEIGMQLLPVFTPLLSRFRELAQEYGPQIAQVLTEQVIPAVASVIQDVADFSTNILNAFQEGGLLGVGAYLLSEFEEAWATVQPELETWPGKFWTWLTDPDIGVLANATAELNKFPTAVTDWAKTFEWSGIGTTIGDSLVGAIGDEVGAENSGVKVIKEFIKSLGLALLAMDEVLAQIGAEIGIGLVGSIAGAIGGEESKNIITTKLTDLLKSASGNVFGLMMMGTGWGAPIMAMRGMLGFAEGGIVPGQIGAPQLAVVHGGEMVLPAGSWNTRHTFEFKGGDSRMRAIAEETMTGVIQEYLGRARK